MNIYNHVNEANHIIKPVITIGTFDGVHLGHLQLINRLTAVATKCGGETTILTFYPHPRMVLAPENHELKLLTTIEEKKILLEKAGINHLIIHPFSREFSLLSSEEFIKNILVEKIHTHKLVIGYDHHFGKNREGSFEHLKKNAPKYGFEVEEIAAKDVDNIAVSSTKIRVALERGDVLTANKYLGYNYFFSGTVTKGRQLGRTLGYPTANIELHDNYKLVPGDGVYAVRVYIHNKSYNGMMSIGFNPTVNGTKRTIEVNIFDFNTDIYGENITVFFYRKLRNEAKFSGLGELKEQLLQDKLQTQALFATL